MSGEVDWTQARCRGINTEVFYLEETQSWERKMNLQTIRKICFSCPIRKACLDTAMENNEHGTWGGISEWERAEMKSGRNDPRQLQTLRKYCATHGISLQEALGEV